MRAGAFAPGAAWRGLAVLLAGLAAVSSLEGQSQPTSISFSPRTVQQGECYTIRAGNAANMTLDLRYQFNGGSKQTLTGWPVLNSSGEHRACTSSATSLGTYVFTDYKNTLASSWISTSKTVIVTAPPSPDFSLSINPSSGSVDQGSSRTYTVGMHPAGGFSSSVSLSISGLRSGNTGSFSPTSISSSDSTSTLTISSSTSASTGSDSFTVTGTGGGLTRSHPATVTVNAPPRTHLSVAPLSGDVDRGSSRTYTVTLNPVAGFTSSMSLSVSGLGAGLTGSFSPSSVSASAPTSTLTIVAGANAAVGTDEFRITGITGPYTSFRATATVTVTSTPPPTHLSVSPLSGNVAQGSSRTYTVTLHPVSGFTSPVSLSVSGLGTGLTGSFSPSSVSSSAPASTLTIAASASAALGNDGFTITGTGGGQTFTASATVTSTSPPTHLSVLPLSGDVMRGSSRTYTVTLHPTAGFTSPVSLSVSGLGTGLTGSFSPSSVSSSAPTSTLTIAASATAALGNDAFTITGSTNPYTHFRTSAAVTVTGTSPPTHLSVSPLSGNVAQGSSRTYTVTLNPASGFTSSVALSVSGLGTGLTGSFSPTSVSSSAPASTLTIAASASAALGNDAFTITGTGGGLTLTEMATATVTGIPPSTHLSVLPLSGNVVRGSSRTYTVTLNPAAGFTSSVALSVSGLGTGLTGSFSPTSVSSSAPASTLTITASSTAALGNDAFTITGTGGGQTLTAPATATVTGIPPQPTSMSFSSTSSFAGNDCFTVTVGNGANMNVVLKYKRDGVWQPESTITMDADGEYENCHRHYDVGVYTFYAIRNALNTNFYNLPSVLTYTINPPQPTSLTISPTTVQAGRGRSFRMTAGNGADVTADVQYTIGGGSTQTLSRWPSLEPVSEGSSTGQADTVAGPCTVLGSYVFTAIRNTLNTPWVSVNAPIRVTAPPAPVVTAVSPSSGQKGTSVDVTLTGSNLCDSSLETSVSGITFSNISYDGITGTTASATITIAPSTPTGSAVITLNASGGSTTFNFQIMPVPTTTSLSIAPSSGDVAQGSSRDYTVTLSPAAGFTSSVSLSVSDLGTGLSGSFSPTSSVSSSSTASTLTITATSNATLGNDEFTVTGTSGGQTFTATATAVVTAPPIILPPTTRLSIAPSSGDVAQGSSRDYTVTLSPAAGFTSPVALSVSGLGTGLTGSFSPTSVSSSALASTLTITASSSAAVGNDTFTVTGTSGSQTFTATAMATVTAPDFSLSVVPSSGDVAQGSSRDYTVTLSPAAGFTSSVALSISGLGTGLSGSFSPTSVSSSSPASTLTITASSTATLGSDEFTVTGTGGGLTRTAAATATVTGPPDFSLSMTSPWAREVWQGSSEDFTIELTRTGGFSGPVALSTFFSGLDASAQGGVMVSLSDDSLEGSDTELTLTVTLTEDFSTSDRFYIAIKGRNEDQDLTDYEIAKVTAKGFNLEISPESREITNGSSGTYTLTLERVGSFSGPVALSISGLGTGLTGSFSDDSLTGSETASTLTIEAASSASSTVVAAIGSDEFTVTGTGDKGSGSNLIKTLRGTEVVVRTSGGVGECIVDFKMVNHNRYVYDSDEECAIATLPIEHSVPWGNWGVSSNVGDKTNGDQFQGWYTSGGHKQWNSCAADYVKPDLDCRKLNFPDSHGIHPYPANGYPFSDPFTHNNGVSPEGTTGGDTCVDQISSGRSNHYGTQRRTIRVTLPDDNDCDGIMDSGGCADLDGLTYTIRNNFMTLYELDAREPDDLVQSLYFQDVSGTLECTVESCFAVADADYDGWSDDRHDQSNSAYVWPTRYQDDWGVLCSASDPLVPCKRVDATIRLGGIEGFYVGDLCDSFCDPQCGLTPEEEVGI